MTETIKVGIVGAHAERGWARAVHLPALTALPDYTITAVAGTSAESARAAAGVWGAAHAFDDPYELMTHPDVDLVVIAVQLPRRDGLVDAAVAAGKHVYCEWPLALTAASADGFRARAQAAGVRHAVGLQSRNHPAVRHLRDLVADGRVGEVLSATLTYSLAAPDVWSRRYAALFDATKGVNHLAVVGGHSLDMFRSVVGDFSELSATLATRITSVTLEETGEPIAVTSPDQIVIGGLLQSGAAASAHFMTGGPAGDGFRIEVHGRAGRLVLRAANDSLVGPEFTLYASDGTNPPVRLPVPDRRRIPDVPVAHGNVVEVYRDLAHGIRTGQPITPDFGTAAATHRLLDAIREAAATGTRQQLR
ncbi:Gfo/Idh/MocA family oxidoreductase [Streptomyces sp. TRM66268-LWL]|uniref:Gfo/Idh/MocA family oxidoreductase n=1 Tax=Streptomyces polyasparticus TaxID=2767826 RepID=A0ABR7STT9_9ACTN|nr:Gfo/Idh/MocA family oxidoreductase [Streptomyces polyasparticus]MBC9717778.1 Gfo/Idh/MocA family oxidoreductase [Streptomyces polyasparticus]